MVQTWAECSDLMRDRELGYLPWNLQSLSGRSHILGADWPWN
jgi:hypothetical protein